jgi:hypothetical protein
MLCILLIANAPRMLHAQNVNLSWAKHMGGTGSQSVGNSIATDASGNVYTTGTFNGTVDFDPGVGVFDLSSGGIAVSEDIFITKLNAAGQLIWAKQMGAGTAPEVGLVIQ